MTKYELAEAIASGIAATGIEGSFASLTCSTGGDYPSLGISSWEGERADHLLAAIPGGDAFIGRTYSSLTAKDRQTLTSLLNTKESRFIQRRQLGLDCRLYADMLFAIPGLGQGASAVYAGMWCPTSIYVVKTFLKNRAHRYDLRNLHQLHRLFYDEYAKAAGCLAYEEGYKKRASVTYDYVRRMGFE